jgi:pilus assembly protein CpaE
MDLLHRRYNFIVIDLPVNQSQIVQELREAAHQSIVVLDPSLPAIRDTLRLLALAVGPRHVGRPLLVLNRAGAPGGLTVAQVEEALQAKPEILIPDIGRRVREAETAGKPVAALRGPMQDAIAEIARRSVGTHQAERKPRFLRRIFG